MNDIILKLEQLGFSSYEAKAYYALTQKHSISNNVQNIYFLVTFMVA